MKYNNCDCNDNLERYSNLNCNMPVRRHLEPVLVARIYNQPIIEELPYSAMSMTLDNMATISCVHSDIKPICGDCGCGDGFDSPAADVNRLCDC